MMIEVAVENIYEDELDWPDAMTAEHEGATIKSADNPRPNVARIVLEIDATSAPDYTAGEGAWDDWAEENIYPFTGIGKVEGDAGYFAEVLDAEDENAVGRTFEWGI